MWQQLLKQLDQLTRAIWIKVMKGEKLHDNICMWPSHSTTMSQNLKKKFINEAKLLYNKIFDTNVAIWYTDFTHSS